MKRFGFVVKGPFEIQAEKSRAGWALRLADFWDTSESAPLRDSSGCYVFALRNQGIVPQDVGLTLKRFDREVFNRSNLVKYRTAMGQSGRIKPVLFLVVPPSEAHVDKTVSETYIGELETFLIQAGMARNPDFTNVKGARRPRWVIRGVTGREPRTLTDAAKSFRKVMGITRIAG